VPFSPTGLFPPCVQISAQEPSLNLSEFNGCRARCVIVRRVIDPGAHGRGSRGADIIRAQNLPVLDLAPPLSSLGPDLEHRAATKNPVISTAVLRYAEKIA
jgi:hypothetical protein